MIVVNRFRVPAEQWSSFRTQANAAMDVFRTKPGLVSVDLVQNIDEPELWAMVGHWDQIGSYRRSLGGYDSKMTIVPLLSLAIGEPSAFADPDDVGPNVPRGFGG